MKYYVLVLLTLSSRRHVFFFRPESGGGERELFFHFVPSRMFQVEFNEVAFSINHIFSSGGVEAPKTLITKSVI